MRHAVALLLAAAVTVAAPVPKALKVKQSDAERLLGTWETVAPDVDAQVTMTGTWTFEVDSGNDLKMFSWAGKPSGPGSEYAIRLRPDDSPKAIDIGSLKGIYAFDGDDLRVAYTINSHTRPTDFSPQPGVYYKRMRRVEKN